MSLTSGELELSKVDYFVKIFEKRESPTHIYDEWVQKLLENANDISEFTDQDWQQIFGYLQELLKKFIENLPTQDDAALQQLNHWWTNTMNFLKWLETNINQLDVSILGLMFTFVLEIIIKTCKITHKSNIKPVVQLQRKLLDLLKKQMQNIQLQRVKDFKGINRVLSSLCDVGSTISSVDIKLSCESWSVVKEISTKYKKSFNQLNEDDKDIISDVKNHWSHKTLAVIVNELNKLFKYLLNDQTAITNISFLKLALFYVQLLKNIFMNATTFPAVDEYIETYIIFMHHLKKKTTNNTMDSIQKELSDFLALVHQQNNIEKHLHQHLLNDNKELVGCDLISEVVRLCLGKKSKIMPAVNDLQRFFNIVFDGPLYFIENEKYNQLLSFFTNLTIEDSTGELHEMWCKHVLDSSWIKAYVSYEILILFYGYYFKSGAANNANIEVCLEFWLYSWQTFNHSSAGITFNHQKCLIEIIIKSIVKQLPSNMLEQYFDQFLDAEILLLKCGVENLKLRQFLNCKLTEYLRKLQNMELVRKEYTQLLNLMDVWLCYPQYVNARVIEANFVSAFEIIFSLTSIEFKKFQHFINKSFYLLRNFQNVFFDKILKLLQINLINTQSVFGIAMLEFLLQQKPKSEQLLNMLLCPELLQLQTFLDVTAKPFTLSLNDLKKFQNIKSNRYLSQQPPSKRLRIVEDNNAISYKQILDDMLENSEKLLNNSTVFDSNDYRVINCIKQNIDKCLKK